MDSKLRYKLKARAFEITTGLNAPGSNVEDVALEVREAVWRYWDTEHFNIIEALLVAVEEHLKSVEKQFV